MLFVLSIYVLSATRTLQSIDTALCSPCSPLLSAGRGFLLVLNGILYSHFPECEYEYTYDTRTLLALYSRSTLLVPPTLVSC